MFSAKTVSTQTTSVAYFRALCARWFREIRLFAPQKKEKDKGAVDVQGRTNSWLATSAGQKIKSLMELSLGLNGKLRVAGCIVAVYLCSSEYDGFLNGDICWKPYILLVGTF